MWGWPYEPVALPATSTEAWQWQPSPVPVKWEYCYASIGENPPMEALEELGADGWEVAGMNNELIILKRPKVEA